MNCLQNLSRCSSTFSPLQGLKRRINTSSTFNPSLGAARSDLFGSMAMKAISGSSSNTEMSGAEVEEKKSETYSNNMTQAMGAVLTYRHELGMNYNFIRPDLIVGSCLQSPEDVDKLRKIGVKTIFCLQQDSDLDYFGLDITAIQEYAGQCDDIQHYRAEIRDFDPFDLRSRLPAVVSKLYKAINRNGGITYVHCTAGLGRAPAVALAYMHWVQGYTLNDANKLLQSKRHCFPKLESIKRATADILIGLSKSLVTLTWKGNNCSTVEVSGLDIGWGQRIPLKFDEERGLWILERELPEGRYEYKYIVDGEWTCNEYELVTHPNGDGHVNNYINVDGNDRDLKSKERRNRLMDYDANLTQEDRVTIRRFLRATWLPGLDPPPHLDGTLAGDFGFDPLGLGEDPKSLKWYVQAELVHCRFAMAGVAGILLTDLLRVTGISNIPVWYEAGAGKYFASTQTLFIVQLILMGFVETKRYMDFMSPGSQAREGTFFGIEASLEGLEPGYPGGPLLNPLGLAKDISSAHDWKLKEIKNGRLAMVAMLGIFVQASVTHVGPIDNLVQHLSDPWHRTAIQTLAGSGS